MITTSDIIKLPFTPDLTEGGIAYATRSLNQGYDHLGGSLYSRLLRIVGKVAVELAFRRYLNSKDIPFEIKAALPFSEPNRFDVLLGGRRCSINTYIASRRNQITSMRRNPAVVFDAPALIPEEELSSEALFSKDLQLFTFLLGLSANSPDDIRKAIAAGQRTYIIHPCKSDWARPQVWAPLERLTLKSETTTPITIEIGGQDSDRNLITESMTLLPLTRTFAVNNYYSLAYIHTDNLPNARVGIHSTRKKDIYIIQPHEWGNIWIYGLEIWLAGYMVQDEFRRKASTTFAGSRVFQYSKTQNKALSIPIIELRALEDLFQQVKSWDIERNPGKHAQERPIETKKILR